MVTVLTIPFDVANQGAAFGCGSLTDFCGGLAGVQWVWMIEFLLIGILVVFLIPMTLFYYESFDYKNDTSLKACWAASCAQVTVLIVGVAIFLLCYFFLRFTELPVTQYETSATFTLTCNENPCSLSTPLALKPSDIDALGKISTSPQYIRFGTPFLVFLPGFLSFVGWFLFSIYTGIGLIALPIGLIRSYIYRPQYIPRDVYTKLKLEIQRQTKELLDFGDKLLAEEKLADSKGGSRALSAVNPADWSRRSKERKIFNEFKQQVVALEEHYGDLKMCHENWKFYNPLIPWFKLVAGIIGLLLSLCWILQIILYSLARSPYGPDGIPTLYFLNVMFSAASKEIKFTFIGTILIGVFVFYLLFCLLKGNQLFGLRFLIVEIHPMKFGETYMNSFLVNVSLLLICIPALISFVASSLQNYIVLTDLDAIFAQQITFLTFFRVFYENNVFIIIMLSVAFLTGLVMFCFPNDQTMKKSRGMAQRMEELNAKVASQEKQKNAKASAIRQSEQEQQALGDANTAVNDTADQSSLAQI